MDIFSLSAIPHIPVSPALSLSSTAKKHNSISFSLKPPPPTPPPPPEPADSSSFRRPQILKSTTTTPAPTSNISKNPFKTLLNTSHVSTPPPTPTTTANYHNLSTKLRLSSKLNPPPPPPPPPSPPPAFSPFPPLPETQTHENESQKTEFRQEGKIFVGNLPNWIKKHELSDFFRQFGPIKNLILIKGHNETERNAGFGFIIYDGPTAETSAMKAVEFDGMEFHGRILTVKLDDGRRLKAKAEERKKWVEGEEGEDYRSKWHEEREGSRKAFRRVLDTQPENWQAVVTSFERIKKVCEFLTLFDAT